MFPLSANRALSAKTDKIGRLGVDQTQGIRVGNYQRPVELIEIAQRRDTNGDSVKAVDGQSFQEMFSAELASAREIQFSKHAHERMFSRGIEMSENDLNGLADAIDKAQNKGSKETLVLSDTAGYVVSIKSRTVITVFDRQNLSDGVVTSIDSAVIL